VRIEFLNEVIIHFNVNMAPFYANVAHMTFICKINFRLLICSKTVYLLTFSPKKLNNVN